MKLVLIRDGLVENVIVPPEGEWGPPEGCSTLEVDDGEIVGPGFSFDGHGFVKPTLPFPRQ